MGSTAAGRAPSSTCRSGSARLWWSSTLDARTDAELELWGARRKRDLFEKLFARDLELVELPGWTAPKRLEPLTTQATMRAVVSTRSSRGTPSGSRSAWNAAMRSIIDTSALAAASGVIASSTRPRRCASATLLARPDEQRPQRLVANRAEPLIAFLRGEVARPEHGAMVVPVADERLDERAGEVEAVVTAPVAGEQVTDRREVLADLLGEHEHRLLDVAEVLVEGRGRGPDGAGDVDDAEVANAAVLEQRCSRVEQPASGERPTPAERAAVEARARRRRALPSS